MDPVIHKLAEMWLQDMNQFSQPWMYYWFFVPAIVYFCMYVIKWFTITLPIWGPILIITQTIGKKDDDNKKEQPILIIKDNRGVKHDHDSNSTE